jgi:hypothetical protein
MTGVQLIGREQVLSTFDAIGAKSWALYQGKQFIVGGTGSDSLDLWLTNFATAGSTATYMLRAYEADEVPTSATGNTDYIACISFKVVDPYEGMGIHGQNSKLVERIGALEKQLKDKDEDSGGEDIGDIVMGWLSDPIKLNQVAGAVRMMFGTGGSVGGYVEQPPTAVPQLQTVSGMNPQTEVDQDALLDQVSGALDVLSKKDKNLVKHLTKLAELAEKEPALFQAVISKLDAL